MKIPILHTRPPERCADGRCNSPDEVQRAAARLSGPPLVEERVAGCECVVSMWGRVDPEHAVVGEIAVSNGVRLVTHEGKSDMESHRHLNAHLFYRDLPFARCNELIAVAKAAWRATGLRGYGTVDMRFAEGGRPCLIDVNPNAAINREGRLRRAVDVQGRTWQQFMRRQLAWAS